jgi:hypothetical protein
VQGPALLLAAAGALFACGTPNGHRSALDAYRLANAASWVVHPPSGCAAGFSGPTLNPGDAIRQARRSALENLAAQTLGVRIESALLLDSGGVVLEHTRQDVGGVIARSSIFALSAGEDHDASMAAELREVSALACPADARPVALGIAEPGFPAWLLEDPAVPDRICVLAVGGPTRDPVKQREAALRDGRGALSLAIESRVRRISLDDRGSRLRVASGTEPTQGGRTLAHASDTRLSREWLDAQGAGPLGLPGVLYGVMCAEGRPTSGSHTDSHSRPHPRSPLRSPAPS